MATKQLSIPAWQARGFKTMGMIWAASGACLNSMRGARQHLFPQAVIARKLNQDLFLPHLPLRLWLLAGRYGSSQRSSRGVLIRPATPRKRKRLNFEFQGLQLFGMQAEILRWEAAMIKIVSKEKKAGRFLANHVKVHQHCFSVRGMVVKVSLKFMSAAQRQNLMRNHR